MSDETQQQQSADDEREPEPGPAFDDQTIFPFIFGAPIIGDAVMIPFTVGDGQQQQEAED